MASLNHTHASTGSVFGVTFDSAMTAVFGRLAAWNDARVTRKTLSTLTDRELDDIGLVRADIEMFR